MSGIQVGQGQERFILPLSGYTADQSSNKLEYLTGQNINGQKRALDSIAYGLYSLSSANIIEAGSTKRVIIKTAHAAKKNDVVYFTSGSSAGVSIQILSCPDANTMILAATSEFSISVGDAFDIKRYVTPQYDSNGNSLVSIAPTAIAYNRKTGGVTTLTQAIEDLDTPANSRAIPVVLHGLDAATSSVSLGDGTTLAHITIGNELMTSDASIHTNMGAQADAAATTDTGSFSILSFIKRGLQNWTTFQAKMPDLGQALGTSSVPVVLPVAQINTLTPPAAITGYSTSANQTNGTQKVIIANATDTATILPASTAALATDKPLVVALHPSTVPSVNVGTISANPTVVIGKVAIDQTTPGATNAVQATNLPTTVATGTGVDSASTLRVTLSDHHDGVTTPISTRESDGTDFLSSIVLAAAQLSSGALTKLKACMSIMMAWDGTNHKELLVDTSGNLKVLSTSNSYVGTITAGTITVGTSAVRATVSGAAPSTTRKKLVIMASDANTNKMFIGNSSVSVANSIELIGPDRMEFPFDGSDYYLISDAAGQSAYILEVV